MRSDEQLPGTNPDLSRGEPLQGSELNSTRLVARGTPGGSSLSYGLLTALFTGTHAPGLTCGANNDEASRTNPSGDGE
jgi:hypothetical protein